MKTISSFLGGFFIGAAIIAVAVFFFAIQKNQEYKTVPGNQKASPENSEERYFDLTGRTEVLISVFDEGFQPQNIIIKKGTKVFWKNEGGQQHYPNLPFLNQKPLEVGESISYIFNEPGIYNYQCGLHGEKMPGKITVE